MGGGGRKRFVDMNDPALQEKQFKYQVVYGKADK